MKFLIDLHSHTNTTPHAYSTLEENVRAAKKKGVTILANTMHGPLLQDSPHWWAIVNQRTLPKYIDGIRVLKGVEANVINEEGALDIGQMIIDTCEIIIGGLHSIPEYGSTKDIVKNTKAILNVIKNGIVDIIVHLGNPAFPVNYEEIVIAAKKYNVAIEFNNGSLTCSRTGSTPNCKTLFDLCLKYKPFISLGSDAHFSTLVGDLREVEKLINGYDEKLILNTSENNLMTFLESRRK
ncbi:MAG: phosphatase [Psychrilyobacter sp.]|nr:phosphatase [Psychrilyobacter sp.]